ncbi:granulocyte-macrophage colony-stimulating factor receptor subunit alpha [Phyllostomus hastatus]|uniref:granulocyte-macrophage colony-stimulating factor receptor subunit alpha n=1 Tax=Phyllostomus hastatus TaxID=9423 RepID=UPI001E6830E2|nr:granulocyte-macrophage colony-stimulating factor receptor subunit alpha [Phyllostomus hastatus]XP_045711960.1 granulocyte-macrophage colony-stimulating factor receptor subunit alpha [Phyllostomus hastatus]XP_045711961.1 granulocyte-macrophage colony-stimulating factor receptor subunit alpha [Phyllostomus hastatus]
MGPLATAVLVAVLFDPVLLLAQHGRPTEETTPGINVQFDLSSRTLTWDCTQNVTATACGMTTQAKGMVRLKPQKTTCQCSFQGHILHEGAMFTVTVKVGQREMTEKLLYAHPGGNNTAAHNFSCFIYDADFMNCTWARGRAAPDDVQYFLYIWDPKRRTERPCRHYATEAGTHVGCHLDFVSELRPEIYVLVNGSSEKAGIQFFDALLVLKKIEVHSPPSNITVGCNASHCLIRWERPRSHLSTSDREFQYQLHIQRQNKERRDGNEMVELSGDEGNKYDFHSPQPRARHTVQIRAADARVLQWGAWSPPAEFGSGEQARTLVHVYLLVILGTVIGALTLGYLFKRFVGVPIPQIKDKVNKEDDEIIWEKLPAASRKAEGEDVLTVQELGESAVSV